MKSSNKRAYKNNFNMFFVATENCPNLNLCLQKKNIASTIEKINNSKYAINSIVQIYQALMYAFSNYGIENMFSSKKIADEIQNKIHHEYKRYKYMSTEQTKQRKKTVVYPTFKEYLSRVLEKYGKMSKEYLVSYLYSQFTVRDNFAPLFLIQTASDDDQKQNFLIKNRNQLKFIINDYKTVKRYHKLEFVVKDKTLIELLNSWIEKRKIKYGDTLFGKSKMSKFVSNLKTQIGYEKVLQGVNHFRHMRISELHTGEDLTFDEIEKLANEMGHNIFTQQDYIRNLKIDGV